MLTLLRRIRRSLVDSGSLRKYILYAIGEIALVVIGILIALQINTWNEQRQSILEGQRYIRQIHTDLLREKKFIKENVTRLTSQNQGVYDLVSLIESDPKDYDPILFQKGVSTAYTPINLDRQKLTWDELLSSGRADIIRDDSLSQLLKDFYHSYELDVMAFNKAPSQALIAFQRRALRNIDIAAYDRAFTKGQPAFVNQDVLKLVAADQEFTYVLREIMVGIKALIMSLTNMEASLDQILEYIEKTYPKD